MYPVVVTMLCLLTLLSTVPSAMPQDIALRMIVVRQVDEAKAIRDQLSKGASFCHLAKTKSIAPSRKQWGFSGVVNIDDVQSELQAIVRKMNPGQISDVTTLGQYYAIVKVISPQVPQLLDTAKQQMNEGKIQPAITSIRQVLKLENDNIQAYILLSVAQSETKSYDAAIQTLKQAQSHAPTEAQIMMLMGTVYTKAAFEIKKSTHSKEAIESFQQVTKLDEGYAPAAQLGLGHIYLTLLKQPQKAIPPLKTSLELAPQIPRTHEYLIQAYIETKNYPQAWQQMRYAQSLGFNFPKLLSQLHKTNKPSK